MLFNLRSESMRDRKVLIFCNTKDGAKQLNYMLKQSGLRSTTIHGNLDQREREIALGQLKSGHCNLLTATDVAARGLDISDIEFVINFDMANNIDEYVHRIGAKLHMSGAKLYSCVQAATCFLEAGSNRQK